jgi:DNA-binding XRE family transcriptional regulator
MTSMTTSPLRQAREELKLSRAKLARAADVNARTIVRLEANPTFTPAYVRICNALAAARLLNGDLEHHDPVVELTDRVLGVTERRLAHVAHLLDDPGDGGRAA